ncbi:hypothetical protein HYH03_014571 [Edaphochlamys debaryana]|uniref:Uncharacterized protein n=1 Tax=Edaphochlamys debaryana TaxID=47281 RepID=A0A835XNT4_9CHLO|nr:hypothetical protein HYH03_014571 [Edaphochlamys debaryana]|eukprot:KAG2486772.1 hypothetical protein HYH03_014571 [Edaphochlamys debaryana]
MAQEEAPLGGPFDLVVTFSPEDGSDMRATVSSTGLLAESPPFQAQFSLHRGSVIRLVLTGVPLGQLAICVVDPMGHMTDRQDLKYISLLADLDFGFYEEQIEPTLLAIKLQQPALAEAARCDMSQGGWVETISTEGGESGITVFAAIPGLGRSPPAETSPEEGTDAPPTEAPGDRPIRPPEEPFADPPAEPPLSPPTPPASPPFPPSEPLGPGRDSVPFGVAVTIWMQEGDARRETFVATAFSEIYMEYGTTVRYYYEGGDSIAVLVNNPPPNCVFAMCFIDTTGVLPGWQRYNSWGVVGDLKTAQRLHDTLDVTDSMLSSPAVLAGDVDDGWTCEPEQSGFVQQYTFPAETPHRYITLKLIGLDILPRAPSPGEPSPTPEASPSPSPDLRPSPSPAPSKPTPTPARRPESRPKLGPSRHDRLPHSWELTNLRRLPPGFKLRPPPRHRKRLV